MKGVQLPDDILCELGEYPPSPQGSSIAGHNDPAF